MHINKLRKQNKPNYHKSQAQAKHENTKKTNLARWEKSEPWERSLFIHLIRQLVYPSIRIIHQLNYPNNKKKPKQKTPKVQNLNSKHKQQTMLKWKQNQPNKTNTKKKKTVQTQNTNNKGF
jgi:hypothetical protein